MHLDHGPLMINNISLLYKKESIVKAIIVHKFFGKKSVISGKNRVRELVIYQLLRTRSVADTSY